MTFDYGMLHDGRWHAGDGAGFTTHNPARPAELTGRYTMPSARGLDAVLASAVRAQAGWRRTTPIERAARLVRYLDVLATRADEIAMAITREQGKLRGFRIELGEVEAGLRRQAGVQEAAVRLVGEGDEAMLVGYVEVKSGVTLNRLALRKGLQATLPHYMVPARLILLDALPKTGSGKLDRKALPLPE